MEELTAIVRQISTSNISKLSSCTFHPNLWYVHWPINPTNFKLCLELVPYKSCDCQNFVSVCIGWTQLEHSLLVAAPAICPGWKKDSNVTQACSGQSVAPNKKPQMSENTQTLARKPSYCALVVSYVGLAAWRFRPNSNWKTSSLVLGFWTFRWWCRKPGNWQHGGTLAMRYVPVKHFYCQWSSENYTSCRQNQGRLFPSGG